MKIEKTVDEGAVLGALLTDLPKAFDSIPYNPIINKFVANGFHIDAIRLIHNNLLNKKQRVKVYKAYSS